MEGANEIISCSMRRIRGKEDLQGRDRSKGVSKMKTWQGGYAHAGVVALSAWLCLETIFYALQWLQGKPHSDSLFLGSYILLSGIACLPIVALHFSHSQMLLRDSTQENVVPVVEELRRRLPLSDEKMM